MPSAGNPLIGHYSCSVVYAAAPNSTPEGLWRYFMRQRQCVVALGGAALVVFCLGAAAQDAGLPEGLHGVLHDRWHQDFYATLRRNDGGGPCCSMTDCRPTQSRKVNGSYEVKLDGA